VVSQFLTDLEPTISVARLQRYQSATGDDRETIVNYLWNMALAESLYCSLSTVEISLRNTIHNTLTAHFGIPTWYDRRGLLEPYQANEVANIKKRIASHGNPVTPDRVVSELNFGFWVTILSRTYDARFWQASRQATMRQAFPRVPKRDRQRVTIHAQFNAVRELRNRVFHHEPLFDDPLLRQRHGDVYRAIHWINPKMVDHTKPFDRFPDVYRQGRVEIEDNLKAHVGIT
jgi:hypothetical protein